MAGVDRTVIEGIEESTALVLLSEIGTDRSRWPSVKHFCSWLGLCPNHRLSGGRVLSRRTKLCAHRAAAALRLAA
jgi:transposase